MLVAPGSILRSTKLISALLVATTSWPAFGTVATGSQTLSPTIGAIGKLAVVQSSISLTHAGTIFQNFTGAITVQYKVRTAISSGSSSLTVQAGIAFSPANGPSI